MQVVRVEVENFRCLRDISFPCDSLTALIGANGTGKSSILKALEFFFEGQRLDDLDCWGGDPEQEVRVTVVFAGLPEQRARQLRPWLDESGHLRLSRVGAPHAGGGRTYWYESVRRQVPEFQEVRSHKNATPLREAYNKVRADRRFSDLPRVGSMAGALTAMADWEEAHPECCRPLANRTLTLDGGGGEFDLAGMFKFILVPAVRDAAEDAVEGRTGSFRPLVELLIHGRLHVDEQLEALRQDTNARYEEILSANGDTVLKETSAQLTERLAALAPGTAVHLRWAPRDFALDPPRVYAEIVEADFAAEVGRQGHGVQRAYLLALLQELVAARVAGQSQEEHPLVVLALEEPELYQHPVRARYLARVLHQLANGVDDGLPTQVFLTTHSPFFVSVETVESLRLLRIAPEASKAPETSVASVNLEAAAGELQAAHENLDAQWSAKTLRVRLRPMVETPVSEGFFASAVVLVEGEEDRAVLSAAAAQHDLDLERRGIALLPVSGKMNLDRALVLYRQLGIPTYVVFDADRNDRQEGERNSKTNRALLRLFGHPVEDFPDTLVQPTFACFENTLMDTIRSELGREAVNGALRRACDTFGFPYDRCKNSVVLREVLNDLASQGVTSATLSELVSRIDALT